MPLSAELYHVALSGFTARPPRNFEYEGRTARDRDGLDFIWRAHGQEPPASGTASPTAPAAGAPAAAAAQPFVPPVGAATPMPELRAKALELGVPLKGKKADIVLAVNAAAKKAHADAAKASKKAGKAPATGGAGEAAKAAASALMAELELLSDDDLAGRAIAAGAEAEGKNRAQLIAAVVEAEG